MKRSTLVLGGCLLLCLLSTRYVRLNISPSVPYGLYRLAAIREPIERGTLVVLPVPASVQVFWSTWLPLLKPVAGLPGDEVCVEQGWLRVAGDWYGPVHTEARGKPLPQWRGCYTLETGEVFVASNLQKSLDGRYFGATKVRDLTAQAVPLVTWR